MVLAEGQRQWKKGAMQRRDGKCKIVYVQRGTMNVALKGQRKGMEELYGIGRKTASGRAWRSSRMWIPKNIVKIQLLWNFRLQCSGVGSGEKSVNGEKEFLLIVSRTHLVEPTPARLFPN